MSWTPSLDPHCPAKVPPGAIDTLIIPRVRDLGGFAVRRVLPAAKRQMVVVRPGDKITLKAGDRGARLMLLGGETFDERRYIWWNFVASSREKIEAAKRAWREADWKNGRFRLPPGDAAEFTPLPDKS